MLVDLVQTTTRDGVRLDGAYRTSPQPGSASLPVDAMCFVHGTGGCFYTSTLFDQFAERLLELGCAVLRVNTRGHDIISTAATPRGGVRSGAAYEVVDDCRHDLAAWADWLRQRAGPRVGLVGHSSGALKCLYALAQEPQIGASRVIALSPPCLSYSRFCASSQSAEFLETFHRAEQHVREGRPAALLDIQFPLPFVITAAGYVEKYGPDERYNLLRFIAGVSCPTLVTFGGKEVESNVAFQGVPEELVPLAARHARLDVEMIAGADHFYTDTREEVIRRAEAWLSRRSGWET